MAVSRKGGYWNCGKTLAFFVGVGVLLNVVGYCPIL